MMRLRRRAPRHGAPSLPARASWRRWVGPAALGLLTACGSDDPVASTPPAPGEPGSGVVLEALPPDAPIVIRSGRRSDDPFRFRARTSEGAPVPGARIPFLLEPDSAGVLSQPIAVSDAEGVVETYLLEARPGSGVVVAGSAAGPRIPFEVERAPGSIEFEDGTGAIGLPGLPHPDSILRVRVLDTEGAPMPDRVVFFSANGTLSSFSDTTDAEGFAEVRLRETSRLAGSGFVFAFLPGFSDLLARSERPTAAPARRVVLVSVDGLRTDAVGEPDQPGFGRLRTEGALGTLRTVTPSLTVPAHLSMLSGVPPSEHRVFSERLQFTPEMNALDPAFRVSVQRGGDTRAILATGGPLEEFEEILECRLAFGFEGLVTVQGDASVIVGEALPAVADTALSAVFVHLPDPDVAGHAFGFDSPEYAEAVKATGRALDRLIDAVPGGTLLIVTSDHGGGGSLGRFQHGSLDPIDLHVPIFLRGPNVPAGGALPELESILDVAPTILWSIGVQIPQGYRGGPLLPGFRNP